VIIAGIDPGSSLIGFGLIEKQKNNYSPIDFGKIEIAKELAVEKKLHILFQTLSKWLSKQKPDYLAVEQLYFTRNVKTAMQVAQSRGVILLVGAELNIPIAEYTPLQVKQAVTGYGKAQKTQIQQAVKLILRLNEIPKPDDVADALAVAICHGNHLKPQLISQ
jgi:crossover junction endodeoxyribonuclease RuvC